MNRKYFLGLVAVLALVAGIYAYMQYTRTRTDISQLSPSFVMKAEELIKEFVTSEAEANKKYAGVNKVVEVTGNIKNIEKDEQGNIVLLLGDTSSMSAVRCMMDSTHTENLSFLKNGDLITVRGYFTGFKADDTGMLGSDVEMNGCILTKKND